MKPGDRALRLPAALLKVGLGKTSWYAEVAAGRAPKPIRLGLRATAWLESELDAYLEARAADRNTSAHRPTAA
jgi:prophage regulatory protein